LARVRVFNATLKAIHGLYYNNKILHCYDITEILMKVALNTITISPLHWKKDSGG
jgi:hypothetical protein